MATKGEIKFAVSCNEVAKPRGGAVRAQFGIMDGTGSMSIHAPGLEAAALFDPETDYDVTFTPRAK